MARIYSADTKTFRDISQDAPEAFGPDIVWLDLLNPSVNEEDFYERMLGIDLPLREEMKSIEPSSRLYRENGALFMTATIISKADSTEPEAASVSFILKGRLFITIRYSEPKSIGIFSSHLVRHADEFTDGCSVFGGLLEAIVERTAEVLERITADADAISSTIFSIEGTQGEDAHSRILKKIAFLQNLMAKIRDSLVTLGRVTHFSGLLDVIKDNHVLDEQLKSVDHDIRSLSDQASFLSSTIGFLLNASLGLINIEQNGIIKFFSVVAVVFLPPTLIASIYGMNFKWMPELEWHWGYPMAVMMMIASAVGPYAWFKFKRWF